MAKTGSRVKQETVSTIVVAAQGELTSRSMGRLSATQSEIYRDVFNDAAVSLVADIFSESIPAADKRKAGKN